MIWVLQYTPASLHAPKEPLNNSSVLAQKPACLSLILCETSVGSPVWNYSLEIYVPYLLVPTIC